MNTTQFKLAVALSLPLVLASCRLPPRGDAWSRSIDLEAKRPCSSYLADVVEEWGSAQGLTFEGQRDRRRLALFSKRADYSVEVFYTYVSANQVELQTRLVTPGDSGTRAARLAKKYGLPALFSRLQTAATTCGAQ